MFFLHLVSWCCEFSEEGLLAPIMHCVGGDGHGRGHRNCRASHSELTVDRIVGA